MDILVRIVVISFVGSAIAFVVVYGIYRIDMFFTNRRHRRTWDKRAKRWEG